jgi:hypothetical protein
MARRKMMTSADASSGMPGPMLRGPAAIVMADAFVRSYLINLLNGAVVLNGHGPDGQAMVDHRAAF